MSKTLLMSKIQLSNFTKFVFVKVYRVWWHIRYIHRSHLICKLMYWYPIRRRWSRLWGGSKWWWCSRTSGDSKNTTMQADKLFETELHRQHTPTQLADSSLQHLHTLLLTHKNWCPQLDHLMLAADFDTFLQKKKKKKKSDCTKRIKRNNLKVRLLYLAVRQCLQIKYHIRLE